MIVMGFFGLFGGLNLIGKLKGVFDLIFECLFGVIVCFLLIFKEMDWQGDMCEIVEVFFYFVDDIDLIYLCNMLFNLGYEMYFVKIVLG